MMAALRCANRAVALMLVLLALLCGVCAAEETEPPVMCCAVLVSDSMGGD